MRSGPRWLGPASLSDWQADREARGLPTRLDVILLTHPRDEQDLPQMYPWTAELSKADRRAFTHHLEPVFGEIIETPRLAIGLLFLPRFADELVDPRTRAACRNYLEDAGLAAVRAAGARVVCLGGLLGALTGYGRRLAGFAAEHDVIITTGHSMTATSVLATYARAVAELELDPSGARMAVLGVGSIGAAFAHLLARQPTRPRTLVLIDKPERATRVEVLASQLRLSGLAVSVELTSRDGQLGAGSACYDAEYVVSATSTPNVIDVDRVAPGSVLIDDSQPNCWSREAAWQRVRRAEDVAPCEAGLINAGSIGYCSTFPFFLAEIDGSRASPVTWCCLAEALLLALDPSLPPTVGEPTPVALERHSAAFARAGFGPGRLQCGRHFLPVERLRESFAGRARGVRAVLAPAG